MYSHMLFCIVGFHGEYMLHSMWPLFKRDNVGSIPLYSHLFSLSRKMSINVVCKCKVFFVSLCVECECDAQLEHKAILHTSTFCILIQKMMA